MMTRVCRTTLVGFAALAMVAMVAASADAQGAGGGGRGGRGGMGMGMGGPGGGMGATMLLQNEQVQKELEIVADQKTALQKIAEEDRTAMRGMRDLSQEERQAKMAENRAKTQKKIDEVLLPPQAKRLKEIQLQVRGNNALLDKEVQKELKITDEQAKKLTAVQEEAGAKRRELFQPGGDMAQMREKMTQLQKEVGDQMLGVLTADQKEAFTKMKGKEFKLDMNAMRGAGRGGRGGRGGAGGGGAAAGGN